MSHRIQHVSMLTICALIFAGLAGLASAQETVYGPYVEVSTSFGDRSPCKGEFVKFDASKSEDRHYNGSVSFAWSVNGQP
ncbi:MAG TPA: hypothetical protein VI818_02460, partial [Candidatus Thermoplasmatota archaeon]|nr:hypothetical protein [Candidatus Thermoplasmatota archaeon]